MKKIPINEIPCKRKRCLIYPACRHKSVIKCDDLYHYYAYIREDDNTQRYGHSKKGFYLLTNNELWNKYIVKSFPNLTSVSPEERINKPSPYKFTKSKI